MSAATLPAAVPSPLRRVATPRRHLAWLAGGLALSFAVPFLFADQLGMQRDLYYGIYALATAGLWAAWLRYTGQSLGAIVRRRWRLAVGLGLAAAAVCVVLVLAAEDAAGHPDGLEFAGAIVWRGLVYGVIDGLLLTAFPILVVFAAMRESRVGARLAVALAASLLMTATYHLGYSDFRSEKVRKPLTGDLIWSAPVLATANPIGAPIAHAAMHVTAVVHSYDTDLFLPPH